MRIVCPQCQNTTEATQIAGEEMSCPACGTTFQPEKEETLNWRPPHERKLGKFELLEKVGEGAFGTVFKARDPELDRVVAIKMPRAGSFTSAEDRDRFLRESRSLAQLHHPGVVAVFEVGQEQGLPFLVSEFVRGVSLADYLTAKRLDYRESAQLIAQLADTLQYAHERGVIHRDVKPGNIMLEMDGAASSGVTSGEGNSGNRSGLTVRRSPRLMDFGLARRDTGEVTVTIEGQVLGTPAYMSPEQALGEGHRVDGRSDIYSLGVVLYELLTDEKPFRGNQRMLLNQVINDEPRQPRSLNDNIPRDLDTICLRAMQKNPARRYPTAGEMAADLRRWLNHEPILARPVRRVERLLRWCQRRPGVAGLIGLLFMVTFIGFLSVTWAWLEATDARDQAEAQQGQAERARGKEEEAHKAERWQRYRSNIVAAGANLQLPNVEALRRALSEAPEEYRGWEWRYLHGQLDRAHAVLRGYRHEHMGLCFSPDGSELVCYSPDDVARLWDTRTGRELAELGHTTDGARPVCFTSNGMHIVTASPQGGLGLSDGKTGAPLSRAVRDGVNLRGEFFSSDGRWLADISNSRILRVWEAATGKRDRAFQLPFDASSVYFIPKRSQVAILSKGEGAIHVWDLEAAKELYRLHDPEHQVVAIDFTADGSRMATGGQFPEQTVRIWNVNTGQLLARCEGHQNTVACLGFSPDGNRLASGSLDQTVRLWDGKTGAPTGVLRGHSATVHGLAISPDGQRLASASDDQTVRLWDVNSTALLLALLGHDHVVRGVAFSPDGTVLASCSDDRTVRVWELPAVDRTLLRGHSSFVYDVAVSGDGQLLASGAWDGTVRLWDVATGRPRGVLPFVKDSYVYVVALSPDGRFCAATAVNMDRRWRVQVWDVARGELQFQRAMDQPNSALAFSPDSKLLAVGGGNGDEVQLWDLTLCRPAGAIPGLRADLARFDHKGSRLFVADGPSIRVFDVRTYGLLGVLRGHAGNVSSLDISADDKWIVSVGNDRALRIWDAATLAPVAEAPCGSAPYSVAIHPSGERLAIGLGDNTVRLWDLPRRSEVAELRGHSSYVHAVAWTPDGTQLLSGSGDFTVRIWDSLSVQERVRVRPEKPGPARPILNRTP